MFFENERFAYTKLPFWRFKGPKFGPGCQKNEIGNDQDIDRIPESVLGGGVEIKARGGGQNVTFA